MDFSKLSFYSRIGLSVLVALAQLQLSAAETGHLVPGELNQPAAPQPGVLMQAGEPTADFHIVVIAGEDSVNIVKKKTAVAPVVEVRDKNNNPVSGAAVTFSTPTHGASGLFLNGSHSITLATDSAGRAAVTSFQPVGTGSFHIAVSASLNGQIASATIAQSNLLTATAASGASAGAATGLSTGAIVGIAAGVAAAVAVGLAVGLTRGSGSSASAISGTIGVGTATVGAPH